MIWQRNDVNRDHGGTGCFQWPPAPLGGGRSGTERTRLGGGNTAN